MRLPRLHASLFILGAFGALCVAQADTVIDNANGYTLNARNELVQFASLAFDTKGKIIAVGGAADVAARAPGAQHVDLHGQTMLPGLIDAHGHVFGLGEMVTQLNLFSTTSLAESLKLTADYARGHAADPWLIGRGWNQENWKLGRFPTAAELDAVVADKPVWLERVDGHAVWVNTRALQAAGITAATRDPVGGKIVRDADGKPTGVLVDKAKDLVDRVLPPTTEAGGRKLLDAALAEMRRVGLTSVHDAGITVGQDALYRDYADHGKLTSRVYAMIGGVGPDFDQLSKHGPLKSYADDLYALSAVKLYSDGALGSRGAALILPYTDDPKTHGLLFNTDAAVLAMMDKAMKHGYQVNVHAIGDASNHQILDAYAKLAKKYPDLRNRIEHAQVVTPADIPRFKTLNIIPSMQPTHATSDKNMAEQRIGPERIKSAYAWRTFLQQGSRIACGSDFPVEAPNPFFGLHAAVTREDARGQPVAGWYPNQAMSLKEAFRCFTLDAAYAAHQENLVGSLEVGKWADFIVVDRDLFTMPTYDIYKTAVLQTWVAGRMVFEKK